MLSRLHTLVNKYNSGTAWGGPVGFGMRSRKGLPSGINPAYYVRSRGRYGERGCSNRERGKENEAAQTEKAPCGKWQEDQSAGACEKPGGNEEEEGSLFEVISRDKAEVVSRTGWNNVRCSIRDCWRKVKNLFSGCPRLR